MIDLGDAIIAWFGWNVLAPLAFLVGFLVVAMMIVCLSEIVKMVRRDK